MEETKKAKEQKEQDQGTDSQAIGEREKETSETGKRTTLKSGESQQAKKQERKKTESAKAEKYMAALIWFADWIPDGYKKLAVDNQGDIDILKGLYLCACDGVPVELAAEVLENDSPEEFTTVRMEHIAGSLPEKQILQDTKEGQEPEESQELEAQHLNEAVYSDSSGHLGHSIQVGEDVKQNVPKSGTGNLQKKRNLFFRRKRSMVRYIERLLAEGYDTNQMNFLLDCIEDGLTAAEIREFASPKLPVDVMWRLKMIEEKKRRTEDGKS